MKIPFVRPRCLSLGLLLCLIAPFLAAQPSPSRRELLLLDPPQRWQFVPGAEFPPGGKGSIAVLREDGRAVGSLLHDFTAGGTYVGALVRHEIPGGYSELRFSVRSEKPASIAIRLTDDTGQTHQTPFRYADTGAWQLFRLDLSRRAPIKFGGEADGVVRYPVRSLTFVVERRGQDAPGEVRFADFVLLR